MTSGGKALTNAIPQKLSNVYTTSWKCGESYVLLSVIIIIKLTLNV